MSTTVTVYKGVCNICGYTTDESDDKSEVKRVISYHTNTKHGDDYSISSRDIQVNNPPPPPPFFESPADSNY